MKTKTNRERAFTLIELLVVVAIIALMSSIVLNNLASTRMKTNDTKITEDLRQFRIAADLYYNDTHTFPPTDGTTVALNNQKENKVLGLQRTAGHNNEQRANWANKLSFFIKKADASATHSTTQLCVNFDNAAAALVAKKYMPAVPVHPYDDDAAGICYKAIKTDTTFATYSILTAQVGVSGGGSESSGIINKRTGFILGDTSPAAIDVLNNGGENENGYTYGVVEYTVGAGESEVSERPFPAGHDGLEASTNISDSVDAVAGITNGAPAISNGSGGSFYETVFAPIVNTITSPSPQENTADLCNDHIDNDGDGASDNYDADCAGFLHSGAHPFLSRPENTLTTCHDGIDNDLDNDVDSADTDCTTEAVCPEGLVFLTDGTENTANGTCAASVDQRKTSVEPYCAGATETTYFDYVTNTCVDTGTSTPQ